VDLEALAPEYDRLKKMAGGLYFVGLKSTVYAFAARSSASPSRSAMTIFSTPGHMRSRISTDGLSGIPAKTCNVLIFRECR
jgi:hypothetical protein